ncbi:hypothetical protein Taro_034577 [Colocasia esculenta]|uniref:Uncharacterized protein n=1 Tax=Colocasia esculenta TaxID=4460 RepID=A0A843W3B0_COLES|nr:hypothetical protein [Colocasia esculenta]
MEQTGASQVSSDETPRGLGAIAECRGLSLSEMRAFSLFSSPQTKGPLCNFTQSGSRTGVFMRRTNKSPPSQRRGTSPEDLRERILERQRASSFAGT